jgi:hypothetical protein
MDRDMVFLLTVVIGCWFRCDELTGAKSGSLVAGVGTVWMGCERIWPQGRDTPRFQWRSRLGQWRSRLELDRYQHAGSGALFNDQGNPLFGEGSQQLVRAELPPVQPERQPKEDASVAVRALPELVAARQLPIRLDELLNDHGRLKREGPPHCSTEALDAGVEQPLQGATLGAVGDEHFYGNALVVGPATAPREANAAGYPAATICQPSREPAGLIANFVAHLFSLLNNVPQPDGGYRRAADSAPGPVERRQGGR